MSLQVVDIFEGGGRVDLNDVTVDRSKEVTAITERALSMGRNDWS